MDTTLWEVLSQMSQVDSERLLAWFLSTAAKSSAGPTCSVSEALTSISTLELEGTTSLASISSPVHTFSTLPAVPLAFDIPAADTPVGQLFFTLTLGLKHKKWDCFPSSTPEGQSSKRVHACTEEDRVNSGCSTLPIQPVASHSSKCLEPELINLPSSPVKFTTDPNNRLAVEALGSTIDCDRDSVVEDSEDDADQNSNESDSSSDSQENAAVSGPESATGDCLTCSDTKKVAINSAHKKFQKKV